MASLDGGGRCCSRDGFHVESTPQSPGFHEADCDRTEPFSRISVAETLLHVLRRLHHQASSGAVVAPVSAGPSASWILSRDKRGHVRRGATQKFTDGAPPGLGNAMWSSLQISGGSRRHGQHEFELPPKSAPLELQVADMQPTVLAATVDLS